MGCGAKCVKIVLIIFNVLFWLFGLGLLAVGIWIKVDPQLANVGQAINIGLSENLLEIVAWIFIGGGVFAFFVGFFGCCGAIKESTVLLGFYIFCLILVFAAEISAAVLVGLRFGEINDKIESDGKNWIQTQYDGKSAISKGFNYVQVEFCCCGINDYRDYKGSVYLNQSQLLSGAYMSLACCKASTNRGSDTEIQVEDSQTCQNEAFTLSKTSADPKKSECSDNFRASGCLDALKSWASDHLIAFIGVGVGVAVLQIFIFGMAVYLCIRFNRDDKV